MRVPTSLADDAASLCVNVLGELTASRGAQVLDLGGRRQRAVLGLLVVARGDAVPTDSLMDRLWTGRPPPGAVGALQAYVSHLRRRLEPDRGARSRASVIVSRGSGYALLLHSDAVDAWRFERLVAEAAEAAEPSTSAALLREASALWRGPAYAEYSTEEWAQFETARLAELREVARDRLIAARLALGDAAVLVGELEALVAADPLREERWRLLVLALYRAQRQGDALAALRRARRTLAEELGVDPGPTLRALEAEVLAQSASLQASDARPNGSVRLGVPAPRPAGEDLVERDRELDELDAVMAEALDGEARLVLVEGPAGIGKTRLLVEARCLALKRGARVFTARGSRLEKEYGFGAVRQMFEAAVVADGPLTGAAAPAAPVFRVITDDVTPSRMDGALATMHGLYWLTVNLSHAGPVVLAVDDLQWCDSTSLRFLSYLVRRVEGLPVLIVATLRTGEAHDDEAVLAELAHDPISVRIRPGPLSETGVADLVRGRLGAAVEDSFVAACFHATSGNPLLLRQLLRAIVTEQVPPDAAHAGTVTAIGSRAVSSLVLSRLARLPAASAAVAMAISVLGTGATLPTVAVLAGVTEDDAAAAVTTLARAEIVRDDHPLGFVHPLVADAVYRDLAVGQRQLQHDRAARVLSAAGGPPEQVAAHLLQVPPRGDPWVVGILRSAAGRARDRAAPDAAIALLTRALQEPPGPAERPGVLLELGEAESIFNAPAATAHLREAYDAMDDPALRTELLQADTGLLWVIAGQVLDLCDEDSAGVWSAGLAQAHARGDMFTMLGMQIWRGWVQWVRGDLREAHQMLTAGNEMSDVWAAGGTASGYGETFLLGVLIDQGDLRVARTYLEHIRPHFRMAESARMFGESQARLLMAEGDHVAALSSLDGVSHLMETVHNPAWRPWRTLRAGALAHLGRATEARDLVEEELELARGWGTPRVIGRTLRVRGVLQGAGGVADLRAATELLSGGNARVELARTLIALARMSDRDEAVALLLRAVDLADATGADGRRRAAMSALAALGVPTPPPPAAATALSAVAAASC